MLLRLQPWCSAVTSRSWVAASAGSSPAAAGHELTFGTRHLRRQTSGLRCGICRRQASTAGPEGGEKGAGGGRHVSRPRNVEQGGGVQERQPRPRDVGREVDSHIGLIQARSRHVFQEDLRKDLGKKFGRRRVGEASEGKFRVDWRTEPGHRVKYRFRIQDPPARPQGGPDKEDAGDQALASAADPAASKDAADPGAASPASETGGEQQQDQKVPPRPAKAEAPYSDYAGLRFPTLETAENYSYHQDRGLKRLVERAFPIKVPGYRRLDPYLREYIHFLHNLDPARFTVERIAERYRLRTKTVQKVVQEWGVNRYLTRSGLTKLRFKQQTKESVILNKKEEAYARWVGWDQLGDQDDPETDDEAIGEFRGWRSTNDWIRQQKVEVEMMSAFPMMEKRDPMPKRVDVDMAVDHKRGHKIINWIDPTDKVVF